MNSKLKVVVIIAAVLVLIICGVALAGIWKFNFTNDDIYVTDEEGNIVRYEDRIRRDTDGTIKKDNLPVRD